MQNNRLIDIIMINLILVYKNIKLHQLIKLFIRLKSNIVFQAGPGGYLYCNGLLNFT
jgi:hypothetical protein